MEYTVSLEKKVELFKTRIITIAHWNESERSLLPLVNWAVRGCRLPSARMRPGRVGFVKSRLPGPVCRVGQPEQQHSPKQSFPAKRRLAVPLARPHFLGMKSTATEA